MKVLLLSLLLVAPAQAFTLLDDVPPGKLQRCINRCYANNPTATPAPTQSPAPTASPLPCESIVGIKTYQIGEQKMLCFDAPADPLHPYVEVSVRNYGNSSCGEMEATLTNPQGQHYYADGIQPNTIVARGNGGKFYLWTHLLSGCGVYGFTPR